MPSRRRVLSPHLAPLVGVCLFLAATVPGVASSSTTAARAAALTEPWAPASIGSLDAHVFQLALRASACAIRSGEIDDLRTLTVIDYSRPSTEKRLWVFDLEMRELLYQELVAHGQGSGENLATTFSNEPNTHASSLGLFTTADTYV